MRELRKTIQNDPNHFYTYSKDYLSGSIDPVNVHDEKMRQI